MRTQTQSAKAAMLAGVVLVLLWSQGAVGASRTPPSEDLLSALEEGTVGLPGKDAASLAWDVGFAIGDLWFPYISNKGFFGLAASTAEYPGGSHNSHLWQGGLWLGGYVDTTGSGQFNEDPWVAVGTFDQLHFFSYDTVREAFEDLSEGPMRAVRTRFNTGASQRDLGVTVEMTIRAWDQRGYDDFLIIEHDLRFDRDVEGFFFGWMSDCDVGNNVFSDYPIDDLVGFDEAAGLAYMYDADGDPIYRDQPDGEKVSTTAIGQMLLEAPPAGGRITVPTEKAPSISWAGFNWWDWNSDVTGDTETYERLSSTSKDGALPSSSFDYRIQTGVGPYSVRAGDTARFVMAYVLGDGVEEDLGPLGSLVSHAQEVSTFYTDGFQIADVSPPAPVIGSPVVDGLSAEIAWSNEAESDPGFDHYNLYGSHATAIGPWHLIEEIAAGTTSYQMELQPGFEEFFLVTSESESGAESNANSAWSKTLDSVEGSVPPAHALNKVTVVPNPYVGSADWELVDYEGKILFSNLPERCTLSIYNLAGDLIYSVEHDDPGRGTEAWNLLTKDRQSVASGLYLYSVTAPGLGQTIGKFAVINGQR